MTCQELITDGFGRVLWILENALDGLTQEELNYQPCPHCNSIGWLTWHLTRWQDRSIALFMAEEQLWVSERWYAKFERMSDPEDTGLGHSSQDVAAFKSPDNGTLLEYYCVVLQRTNRYLVSLSTTDLHREINDRWYRSERWHQSKLWHQNESPRKELPPLGIHLISVMNDNIQHAGQIAYLPPRGLLRGKGWYGA